MDDVKQQGGSTRRSGLGAGLKVALAAPAALAALPLGTAAAQGSDDDWERGIGSLVRELIRDHLDDFRDGDRPRRLTEIEARLADRRVEGLSWQQLRLLKVADVSTGGDFDKGNAAGSQDSLARGAVHIVRAGGGNAGRVLVSLAGAVANVTYAVVFARFHDHNRESLGNVRTDGRGNFSGLARSNSDNTGDPGSLGGNNRIGAVVLTRDGKDQFIAGYQTQ
jgi:hypothetical protein